MPLTKWERTLLKQQRPTEPPEEKETDYDELEKADKDYDDYKEKDL